MESNPIYYVTSKGAVKSGKGPLTLPGEVFSVDHLTDRQIESYLSDMIIARDFKEEEVYTPIQAPLPHGEAGTMEETKDPATMAPDDRRSIRVELAEAKLKAQALSPDVEVLGSGPMRVTSPPLRDDKPAELRDDKTEARKAAAGQRLTVEQAQRLV